jgi:hypothetical protein
MKTIFFVLIFGLTIAYTNAQTNRVNPPRIGKDYRKGVNKTDVPPEVKRTFDKKYSSAVGVEWYAYPYYWDMDREGMTWDTLTDREYAEYAYPEFYEAEFTNDGATQRTLYSRNGNIIHTKRVIRDEDLPLAVQAAFKTSEYRNWTIIKEKEKIERPAKGESKELIYSIKVENGKERHVLHYDEAGKLVQIKKQRM